MVDMDQGRIEGIYISSTPSHDWRVKKRTKSNSKFKGPCCTRPTLLLEIDGNDVIEWSKSMWSKNLQRVAKLMLRPTFRLVWTLPREPKGIVPSMFHAPNIPPLTIRTCFESQNVPMGILEERETSEKRARMTPLHVSRGWAIVI